MQRAASALATPEVCAPICGGAARASLGGLASPASTVATPIERAHALFLQQRNDDALPYVHEAISAEPERADAWTLLGILEQRAGRLGTADAAYREALRLHPDYVDAWTNLGNLRRDCGDRRGALIAFQHAMRLAPGDSVPVYNLGVALERFGDWAGALVAFEAAVECDPGHVDAHWNLALALLRHGRIDEGFREYEWRFRRDQPSPGRCARPVWDGRELGGATLLVRAEQGFGDALQFFRFVPEAARRGARVVLQVPQAMHGLAQRIPGVAAVVTQGDEPPEFDTHVSLMSLPFVLGTTLAGLASHHGYLRADPHAVDAWQRQLIERGLQSDRELAVGVVWAGNPAVRNACERSPGLATLRGLMNQAHVRWFSLQKGAGCAEIDAAAPPASFVDLQDSLPDFDATAAVIANLDIVVTCDTAVAHLAGALGKPTFAMLPFTPDWRYGLDRDTTPWYASMRLFRQAARDDWTNVLDDVSKALSVAVSEMLPRDSHGTAGRWKMAQVPFLKAR
jgi:tetratricopeptide (TPR) repeat protein